MSEKYIEIARKYILENCGEDVDIVEDEIIDYGDLFCFIYQSKKYLETHDDRYALIGQGPIFIVKKDNRILEYGSAFSYQRALIDAREKLQAEDK